MLIVRELTFAYRRGWKPAVENVTFTADAGELHGLVGPSASGKTTILRLISGFEECARGSVLLDGRDLSRLSLSERRVQLVFQDLKLFDHMTVEGNVTFGAGTPRDRQRARELMSRLEIDGLAARPVTQISQGQRQRTALARSLVARPGLLLLDEPTTALDARMKNDVMSLVSGLAREMHIPVVVTSHDVDVLFRYCDSATLIDQGKVLDSGRTRDLYDRPRNLSSATLLGEINCLDARSEAGRRALEILHIGQPIADADRFYCCFRPESVSIARTDHAPVRVVETRLVPPDMRVTLDVAGQRVVAHADRDAVAIGDEVGVTVAEERLLWL